MYKVFVNDSPLIFSNEDKLQEFDINSGANQLVVYANSVIHGDANQMIHHVFKNYKWIVAAGGVVCNEKNQVLIIKRLGKWDLPKGKLEKGETVALCAKREVEEECNVTGLKIINELQSTFHTYEHKDKQVLKRTYWYEMTCGANQELIPQTEEGIEEIIWIDKSQLKQYMAESYNSLKFLIDSYLGG